MSSINWNYFSKYRYYQKDIFGNGPIFEIIINITVTQMLFKSTEVKFCNPDVEIKFSANLF